MRVIENRVRSQRILRRSAKTLAGGIGSSARILAHPFVVERAKGSRLWDVDGNEYVDLLMGQGPVILGHAPDVLTEPVARVIQSGTAYAVSSELEALASAAVTRAVPCMELIRFSTSGSEAVVNCLRLARAYTGRYKLVKFEGHFHGTLEDIYVSVNPPAGSGMPYAPWTVRENPGQPLHVTEDVIVLPWNDPEVLERTLQSRGHEIAAVIMEPVMFNNGGVLPEPGYLPAVREITQKYSVLLVFDEIITGFRLALGGAQEYYGVLPDLCTIAKAMGAGYPVSALGGRRDIMDLIATNAVPQYGTYNANPLSLTAVMTTIAELSRDNQALLRQMHVVGRSLREGLDALFVEHDFPMLAYGHDAAFYVVSPRAYPKNYRDVLSLDFALTRRFHAEMLARGVLFVPKGRIMLSTAHSQRDVDDILAAAEDVIRVLKRKVPD
jgi:glutamate-1-semialdehyde 2,1-aminomutase